MFGEMGPTTELDRSPVEWGAGGLVAPAADASRFIRALMSGALLEPGSLSAMQAFHDTPRQGIGGSAVSERRDGYGLGLVRLELPGATLIGHGGLFTGHTSGVWYLPACGATIAIYLNRGFVGQRDALEVVLGGLEFVEASLSSCRVS